MAEPEVIPPRKSRRGGHREGSGRKKLEPTNQPPVVRSFRQRYPVFPLEHFMTVLNNEKSTAVEKMEAAREAAPYVHFRLAALKVESVRQPINHSIDLTKLSDDELIVFERILAKAQIVEVNDDQSKEPLMIDYDPETGEARAYENNRRND